MAQVLLREPVVLDPSRAANLDTGFNVDLNGKECSSVPARFPNRGLRAGNNCVARPCPEDLFRARRL